MRWYERQWERIGQIDPYFGVLSRPNYRSENFDDGQKTKFYASGEEHVGRLLAFVHELYPNSAYGRALDFGCGVGRLVLPLASRFGEAVGVDISSAMIEVARARANETGARNVSFHATLDDVTGCFDFVHSYIVFQHIPVSAGLNIVETMADRLTDTGILAVHFVLVMDRPWIRTVQHEIRKRLPPWHYAMNVVTGRNLTEPLQEMNSYPLNAIVYALFKKGLGRIQLIAGLSTDFGPKIFSAYVIARRNDPLAKKFTF